jgi:hypothetical protein
MYRIGGAADAVFARRERNFIGELIFILLRAPRLQWRASMPDGHLLRFSTCLFALAIASVCTSALAQQLGQSGAVPMGTISATSFTMPLGASSSEPIAPGVNIPRPRTTPATAQQAIEPRGAPVPAGAVRNAPSVLTSCPTNDSTGFGFPDVAGAAGPVNLVVVTNVDIAVYNKTTCNLISRVSLSTFFASGGVVANEVLFNPQVFYDATVGRFFVTAVSCVPGCPPTAFRDQYQHIAVSQDSGGSPLDATRWWIYVPIVIRRASDGMVHCVANTDGVWDNPRAGTINGANSRWLIVGNVIPASGGTTSAVLSIAKTPTLNGGNVNFACPFTQFPQNMVPPIVMDSSSHGQLCWPSDFSGVPGKGVACLSYTGGSDPAHDSFGGAGSGPVCNVAWTAPPKAAQPNGQLLDTLDGRFVSPSVQWGDYTLPGGTTVWNVHTVNVGGFATARLYEMAFPLAGTSICRMKDLHTAGNDHIFNASVAANATQAFVTASRTIPSQPMTGNAAMVMFKGPRFSTGGGWVFDVIATSPNQFTGCDPFQGCPWGHHSTAQIDPSDNTKAWGFNELVTGTASTNWVTQAALVTPAPRVNTHDFNSDGMSDLLWVNGTSGQALEWLISGTSVIGGGSPGGAAPPWAIVGQGDFNGDGFADLLWRNGTSGQLVVWLLNATSVIGGGSLGGATSPWQVAGAGDFNGDGFGDVLWWNSSTGQLVIWYLNGTSVIGGGSPGGAANPWKPVYTGDFNGDGFADILWWNSTSGQLVIWFMNGTSVIGGGSPGTAAPPWQPFGTGDFNGDGFADILWLNTSTGQAVLWFLNGTSLIGGGSPGGAASPWTIAETGDFNGDGMSDILWSNSTTGQLIVWLLNGTSVIGGGSPGGATSPWVIQGMNAD